MKLDLPYQSLRDFLQRKGLLNATGTVLRDAKQEWYRMYQRAYKKGYEKKQMNCVMTMELYTHVREKAGMYVMKPTEYIRHLIECDMKGAFGRPNQLIDMEVQILALMDELHELMKILPNESHLSRLYQQLENLLSLCL